MTQLKTHARFGLLMSALALASAPSAVLAQDSACATDDDCEHGYSCEQVGGSCPAVDCAEGSDCEQQECEPLLGCVPVRGCDADADCAEGWKCASEERSSCNGGAAEPTCPAGDEECPKPELPPDTPEDCTTETYTQCLPPWMLPCEEAADCGPGFDCVERIEMSCSSGGSAGEPTPSGDPAPPDDGGGSGFAPPADGDPLPPECTSNPTGEYQCQLVPTECETDADCASGLTCQELPSDSACSGGGSDPGAGGDTPEEGGAGGADGDADRPAAPPVECETPEPTYACAPPQYFDGSGWGYDLEGRGEATSGGDVPDSDNGSDPSGTGGGEEPPAAPVDDDGLESEDGSEAAAGDGMSESSGCSATSSSQASGSALWMALAVLGLAFRRRGSRV